ncbi:MAG: AI-2E family transporter [Rickettsiales bacterium]|nr:AI-2E family transporter [Rickettsiales bacterium]
MKTKDKVLSILTIFAALFWLIYLVKSVLTPFILSLIIAYFLDPLVDRFCTKCKLSRLAATSIILGLFLVILVALCSLLLPIIYTQFLSLLEALPGYFQILVNDFYPKIAASLNKAGFKLDTDFSHLIANEQVTTKFVDLSQNIFNNALSSSVFLINILSLVFITPILVFYLLKDWDLLVAKINNYLPRTVSSSVKKIAADIDKTLSGYVRGQFNVCLILGIIYSSLLSFTGLNFGFLIGFLTGLFSFIPYVGMLSGVTAAVAVALFQWGFDGGHITAISVVFIFGQILESNFLTPKLIGEKIGLHPVWLIFGLFIFGALFGFVGVLIAVPLTAICGVIIKHFALEYKKRFT